MGFKYDDRRKNFGINSIQSTIQDIFMPKKKRKKENQKKNKKQKNNSFEI